MGPPSLANQLGIQNIDVSSKGWAPNENYTGILGMNKGTLTQPDITDPNTVQMIDLSQLPPPPPPEE